MSHEAIEAIIKQMQIDLPSEEIPAAIEHLLEEKHQQELEDLLLKLYEQKAVELREEVVALIEEKSSRQRVLKKNAEDRERGLEAIISRAIDPKVIAEMEAKKAAINVELDAELAEIERDYSEQENAIHREIQSRTMDREVDCMERLQRDQLGEKREIFNKYLPDNLMQGIYDSLDREENEEMAAYRNQIEKDKADRLREMEEQAERERAALDDSAIGNQAEADKLASIDARLKAAENAEKKRLLEEQRRRENQVNAKDLIQKMAAEHQA